MRRRGGHDGARPAGGENRHSSGNRGALPNGIRSPSAAASDGKRRGISSINVPKDLLVRVEIKEEAERRVKLIGY